MSKSRKKTKKSSLNKQEDKFEGFASYYGDIGEPALYISDIIKSLVEELVKESNNIESQEFKNALNAFSNYVEKQYKQEAISKNVTTFIDTLFQNIAEIQKQDIKVYMIIINELINIKLGDKIHKANKILGGFYTLNPAIDALTWSIIEYTIIWLVKTLKYSVQTVYQPILDKIFYHWNSKTSTKAENIAKYQLLIIMFKNFPQSLQNKYMLIPHILIQGIKYEDSAVQNIAAKASKAYIDSAQMTPNILSDFFEQIKELITNRTHPIYCIPPAVDVGFMLYKVLPNYSILFEKIDFSLAESKDINSKRAWSALIPFIYKATPTIFTHDIYKKVFSTYNKVMKKKSGVKWESEEAFANFIFLHKGRFDNEERSYILNKLFPKFLKKINTEFGIYVYIALMTARDRKCFEDDATPLFTQPLTPLTISGFCQYIKINKNNELTAMIHRTILSLCDKPLFNLETPKQDLIFSFESLRRLKISAGYISIPLALRYSLHLDNKDIEARIKCFRFLFEYHKSRPSIEMLIRLLTAIAEETNPRIRLEMFKHLYEEPKDIRVLPVLKTLLHDNFFAIQRMALQFLTSMYSFPESCNIISEFLMEKIHEIRHATEISSKILKCFIIVFSMAFEQNSESLKHLLVPFSDYLLEHLLSAPPHTLPACSLDTISYSLQLYTKPIDLSLIVQHIENSLVPHSTSNRLNSAIELFISTLSNTDLRFTMYEEHQNLLVRLYMISKLDKSKIDRSLLLEALSLIGAIRPSYIKSFTEEMSREETTRFLTPQYFISQSSGINNEESIQLASTGVTIAAIFDILNDESLLTIFAPTLDTLLTILHDNKQIIPDIKEILYLNIKKMLISNDEIINSCLLANLPRLINSIGEYFAPILPEFIAFICRKWYIRKRSTLINVVEILRNTIPDELTPYIVKLAIMFLEDIDICEFSMAESIFSSFVALDCYMDLIGHVVYPAILKWIYDHAIYTEVCSAIIGKLGVYIQQGGALPFASHIIRILTFIVEANPDLSQMSFNVIFFAAKVMGEPFLIHLPYFRRTFKDLSNPKFEEFISQLEKHQYKIIENKTTRKVIKRNSSIMKTEKIMYQAEIVQPDPSWDSLKYQYWFDTLTSFIIAESPSSAISTSIKIAMRNNMIQNAIFPIAYVSMFNYYSTNNLESKVKLFKGILESIFKLPNVPHYIINEFLLMIEIFEVIEYNHKIDLKLIAEKAEMVGSYSQALRYYESLYTPGKIDEVSSHLIALDNQLGLHYATKGILSGINKNEETSPFNKAEVIEAVEYWKKFDHQSFLRTSDTPKIEGTIYEVIKYVLKGNYLRARVLIQDIRVKKCDKLFPSLSDNYERIYQDFAETTFLKELENVIEYKNHVEKSHFLAITKREKALNELSRIEETWKQQFSLMMPIPDILLGQLCIQSMVLDFKKLRNSFITLIESSLKDNNFVLAETIIQVLIDRDDCNEYRLLHCKILWAKYKHNINEDRSKNKAKVFNEIDKFDTDEGRTLKAKWLYEIKDYEEALKVFEKVEKNTQKQREIWSNINLALYEEYKHDDNLINAFESAMDCMAHKTEDFLEIALNVIQILYKFGRQRIYESFNKKLPELPVKAWIVVLPQIMSRLTSPNMYLKHCIENILIHVGKIHPHAVLFTLNSHSKLKNEEKRRISLKILNQIRDIHPNIVESVTKFAKELERISLTWWEIWKTYIELATAAKNFKAYSEMISILNTVFDQYFIEPESVYEKEFMDVFKQDLEEAHKFLKEYEKKKDEESFKQMWLLLTNVLNSMKLYEKDTITLDKASSYQSGMACDDIIVPGTFDSNGEQISIHEIINEIPIIHSARHPRKLIIIGSNGIKYSFLLKAQGDFRLDERIMQIFTFLNKIVLHSNMHFCNKLLIETYKVIPVSGEVGLISWVNNCDTLNIFISDFRRKHLVPKDIEYEATIKYTPNYNDLPLKEKVYSFKKGCEVNPALDLKKILFLHSNDSNHWLERRTNLTTSLAMNSMAGYILGLGDRHMNNILMKEDSAKLVHIDFDVCFEEAMTRSFNQEKVPFRLTRMLTNCLEVTGIEGTFRSCCENVMKLMRTHENRDQIIKLFNPFIYDPIQKWNGKNDVITVNEDQEEDKNAIVIIDRIKDKLNGREFEGIKHLSEINQVDMLIKEATNEENLCQMYKGWYPWW